MTGAFGSRIAATGARVGQVSRSRPFAAANSSSVRTPSAWSPARRWSWSASVGVAGAAGGGGGRAWPDRDRGTRGQPEHLQEPIDLDLVLVRRCDTASEQAGVVAHRFDDRPMLRADRQPVAAHRTGEVLVTAVRDHRHEEEIE